ncbi:MAG: nucleotidyltransferase family protein [Bacteroidales bacterium]|nr:nucleotidyltransferase family protein [Bacteroidales bacterium]
MEAIVLAGGFGTRLQHVVSDVPKPMAPVAGRPFVEYLFDQLVHYRFDHIVLSTGYKHEAIEGRFGTAYRGMELTYAREETPLGTGGGLRNALQFCREETVTVLNGDTLFLVDHESLSEFHRSHGGDLTIVLRQVGDTSRYGSVAVDGDHRIVSFTEKGAAQGAGLINGGIYAVNRRLLLPYPVGQKFSFEKDVLESRYRDIPFYAMPCNGYFIDIGVPDDYRRAQSELQSLLQQSSPQPSK